MRHFLKFIPADKRAQAEREYGAAPAPTEQPRQAPRQAQMARRSVSGTMGAHERRAVSHGVHAPAEPGRDTGRREALAARPKRSAPATDTRFEFSARGIKARLEASAAVDNTASYLAALDNSALTLADSGTFEQQGKDAAPAESFNPYNRGWAS